MSKPKRTSFLVKKKEVNDRLHDLIKVFVEKKYNKKRKRWENKGVSVLAKKLRATNSRISNFIKLGYFNDNGDMLPTNLYKLHKKLKLGATHKVTKQFTVHNFTIDNFFKIKNIKEKFPPYRFYFRCGLYIVFEKGYNNKKDTVNKKGMQRGWAKNDTFIIENFPICDYADYYKEGFYNFFDKIKDELQSHPSAKFFRFNYFDVNVIDPADYNKIKKTYLN